MKQALIGAFTKDNDPAVIDHREIKPDMRVAHDH